MDQQLQNNTDVVLPAATVTNSFAASMEVSGVGPRAMSTKMSSDGDGETGSIILGISDRLIAAMVPQTQNQTRIAVQTPTVDLSLHTIGPGNRDDNNVALTAKGQTMEINLQALASTNDGSAAAAFMTLNGMESLLSHQYFKTENMTEMYSDVFTAIIPTINTTNLTEPVNFTIQHKKVPESGIVTCVYWKEQSKEEAMQWSVAGCWVAFSEENYTVCSCSHLSTFALIMQIGEPPPDNPFLDWLNRMCVIVGLFFLALAIFTFILCSWNPKINNTARLHLCLNLFFTQLLLLWNDKYVDQKLACKVMAGLLHFLVIASFVWMLLEALQLHLLVRRLSKVQVIQRDGLPRPLLYLIGYGVPFVIVGVSALIYSDGYGATGNACWLSRQRNFNWALTGPVIVILGLNWILFCATLWSLRPTLVNMKSDVSQSKDTRLILFKIVAQFVILGCTWILGLYQTNLFFKVLFIILNSQQGTFLYIVHCLLNKEVRDEYVKWLTCSLNKPNEGRSVKDAPSVSEDWDKTE
ncbi:adhesion G protein-coupled receptor E1 [Perca flavescens]|uniref:adhesion G protein-coupled receptor E1 n=1 Tax=Perca flavescens TaxID=8167 RepID=UPI00106E8965|nr:adhesion G protein-coupled receptor E1-like [Perca flavescens]